MGLHIVLVDEQGGRTVLVALGSGNHVLGELEEPLDTDVLLCADAEHGISLAGHNSEIESLADFILGKHSGIEELLHQGVIVLSGLLDELLAHHLGLVLQLGRDIEVFAGAVGILEVIVLVGQDIHEAVEAGTYVDRELDINQLVAHSLLEGSLHSVPVCLVGIELIDSHHKRELLLGSEADDVLSADLDSLLGIHHKNTGLAHLEGGVSTSDEVIGTGSVDDIYLGSEELSIKGS